MIKLNTHLLVSKGLKTKLILFILYPFFGLIYALRNLKSNSSQLVIYLFLILYGFSFQVHNDSLDSFRYVEKFNSAEGINLHTFILKTLSYSDWGEKDLLIPILTWIIKLITNNYHFLYMVFGALFGFFYIGSLKYILKLSEFKYNLQSIILLLIITLSNPIFNINGIRFYLACWVAVYSTYKILIDKNYYAFILLFFTPFVHYSFYIYLAFFLFFLILQPFIKNKGIYIMLILLFCLSFIAGSVSTSLLTSNIGFLPPVFQRTIESYFSLEKLSLHQNDHWYWKVLSVIPIYVINIMLFIAVSQKSKREKLIYDPIVLFTLLYSIFTNTFATSSLVRFQTILFPLVIYIWFKYVDINKYQKLIICMPLFFFYPIMQWCILNYIVLDIFLFFPTIIPVVLSNL